MTVDHFHFNRQKNNSIIETALMFIQTRKIYDDESIDQVIYYLHMLITVNFNINTKEMVEHRKHSQIEIQ